MKKVAIVWLAAVMAIPLMGCDSGGGGSGPSGNSTVQGNVNSIANGSALYRPGASEGWRGMLGRVANLILPRAWAAVEGVSIRVVGTDLVATTADDGSFIISGVPAGQQTLIFSYGSTTSSLDITVPANATVKLRNIDVSTGSVDVGSVDVEVDESNDNGNSNVNGNDDNDNDDNGNDDNDNDDNGNDDDDNGNDDNDNDDDDNGNDDNDNDDDDNENDNN